MAINGKDPVEYLGSQRLLKNINTPIATLLSNSTSYDIRIDVKGGGISAQSDASKLAVSRALLEMNEEL